jgi:hypothetical protein
LAKRDLIFVAGSRVARFFLIPTCQNVEIYTKGPQNIRKGLTFNPKEYKSNKWPLSMPTFFIPKPSKIYQNWYFWFEMIPSGNPGKQLLLALNNRLAQDPGRRQTSLPIPTYIIHDYNRELQRQRCEILQRHVQHFQNKKRFLRI